MPKRATTKQLFQSGAPKRLVSLGFLSTFNTLFVLTPSQTE